MSLSDKWYQRGLDMAELVAGWSKDPSTQCGAVVMRPDKTIASVGFNGFPKGCSDDDELYADRELKYARVVHAEQNALLHARESLEGYTMFTYPGSIGPSCDRCTAHIIQAGIKEVVHYYDNHGGDPDWNSRWGPSIQRGLDMYEEAGVHVVPVERPWVPSQHDLTLKSFDFDDEKTEKGFVDAVMKWDGSE